MRKVHINLNKIKFILTNIYGKLLLIDTLFVDTGLYLLKKKTILIAWEKKYQTRQSMEAQHFSARDLIFLRLFCELIFYNEIVKAC